MTIGEWLKAQYAMTVDGVRPVLCFFGVLALVALAIILLCYVGQVYPVWTICGIVALCFLGLCRMAGDRSED